MSIEGREWGHDSEEEKEKFKAEFLENETRGLDDIIKEVEARRDKGDSRGAGETIRWLNEAKRMTHLGIDSEIRDFKKWMTQEGRAKRLESNLAAIEGLNPGLENRYTASIAKQKIEDMEKENRIISAINEGKL